MNKRPRQSLPGNKSIDWRRRDHGIDIPWLCPFINRSKAVAEWTQRSFARPRKEPGESGRRAPPVVSKIFVFPRYA
jgi:hypothetical protein